MKAHPTALQKRGPVRFCLGWVDVAALAEAMARDRKDLGSFDPLKLKEFIQAPRGVQPFHDVPSGHGTDGTDGMDGMASFSRSFVSGGFTLFHARLDK